MIGEKHQNSIVGMSDAELEEACNSGHGGAAFWHNWTSELYSLGRCLRYMAKYPSILPLYVQSDHGVGLGIDLYPNELNNNANIHFTWLPGKELRYKNLTDPKVVRIPHPWIFYRRAVGKQRSKTTKGTLVFFTHHVPGIKWQGHDSEEYFAQLRALPDKFQPVVICLHKHDVNAGHHKELRRHAFPIVTAGDTSSTGFVDQFYALIKDYSYATSPDWGTQVAYCVEFGLPYFFLGARPKLINLSHPDMELGEVVAQDREHLELEKQAEALFRQPVDVVSAEQRAFVESQLGCDSQITPDQISRILWREFFRHWRQWPHNFKYMLIALLRKIGCFDLVRKMYRYFKGNIS